MTRTELLSVLGFIRRTRQPALDCLGLRVEDPIWNMVLYLMERHLRHQPVTITSLARSADIAYTTALRRIDDMFEAGLLLKRKRGRSGKLLAIEPSQALMARFNDYAMTIKLRVAETLGRSDEAPNSFYFGGAYLSARIIPEPGPCEDLGPSVGALRFLLKRQPSFSSLFRLRARLQQLAGCRIAASVSWAS